MALFSLLTLWTSGPFCEAVEIVLYVFQRSFLSYVLMYFAATNSITTSLPQSFRLLRSELVQRRCIVIYESEREIHIND